MGSCNKCGFPITTINKVRARRYCLDCFREQCRVNAQKYYEKRKRPCDCGGWIINPKAEKCKRCENLSRPLPPTWNTKGRKWTTTQRFLMTGENHPLYKGGINYELQKLRRSPEYISWRTHVFQRDDFTCQGCGKRGCYLEADHELPFSLYPDLRFEVLNGRSFCKSCHYKYGWNIFRENNPRKAISTALGVPPTTTMDYLLT